MATLRSFPGRAVNKENNATKFVDGKSTLALGSKPLTRPALEDVRNHLIRHPLPSKAPVKPGLKGTVQLPNQPAPINKGRLEVFNRQDVRVLRSQVLKEKSPEPMELEIDELTEAFSTRLLPLPPGIADIDSPDGSNPQLCSDYVVDIYRYLRLLEKEQSIQQDFLNHQKEITSRMRAILVDWLIQVHQRFHLLQETLYMTVAILDRFLQKLQVSKSNLQLVGVSAMFLASKYEEMYAPELGDFVYITDNTYRKREILKMEMAIFKVIGLQVGRPLPLHFLRRLSKAADCDSTTHTLAKYIMELTLPEYSFAHLAPSVLAAASLLLSLRILDDEGQLWTPDLAFYSGYSQEDLSPLVQQLASLLVKADTAKLQSVRQKYSSSKLMKISLSPELTSGVVQALAKLA